MSNWNTTVRCIQEFNPGKGATFGQTYEIINGVITYDNGEKSIHKHENLYELNRFNMAKFVEIKL